MTPVRFYPCQSGENDCTADGTRDFMVMPLPQPEQSGSAGFVHFGTLFAGLLLQRNELWVIERDIILYAVLYSSRICHNWLDFVLWILSSTKMVRDFCSNDHGLVCYSEQDVAPIWPEQISGEKMWLIN